MSETSKHDKTSGVVVYLDSMRKPHLALVTEDFSKNGAGAMNLIYVNNDMNMKDGYGQQILRPTSVGFWADPSYKELLANCWMFLGDYNNIVSGSHGQETKNKINGRIPEATQI